MERLINVRETAERMGLSVKQIYNLIATNRFGPAVIHPGGSSSSRVRESELDSWIAQGCPVREQFQFGVLQEKGKSK